MKNKVKPPKEQSTYSKDIQHIIPYLSIPEIATVARCQIAAHAIKIPPRRLVVYTDRIANLLATDEMTWLGNTRQLGFTHLVYPGAQGTRFEHSIGVYDTACHLIIRLCGQREFSAVCPNGKDVVLFILAVLLHDIGHFPFAHQLEEFIPDDFSEQQLIKVDCFLGGAHERFGCNIIKNALSECIKENFSLTDSDINRLTLLIKKELAVEEIRKISKDNTLKFFRSLISGPIDVDKLDYMERDAHHCGVPYGNYIDIERLFETMRIVNMGKQGFHLAFDQRGVGCLEQAVTARHQLYANVYWHRAVRAATVMFKHLFYIIQEFVTKEDLEKIFWKSGSDQRCLFLIEQFIDRISDKEKKEAASHLLQVVSGRKRSLYKTLVQEQHSVGLKNKVGETYLSQRRRAVSIFKRLKSDGFLSGEADKLGSHNILIDCRIDTWPEFGKIFIVNGSGNLSLLRDYVPYVEALKECFEKQACQIRVFINVNALKEEFRDKEGRAKLAPTITDCLNFPVHGNMDH